jgi:hypothetical protein
VCVCVPSRAKGKRVANSRAGPGARRHRRARARACVRQHHAPVRVPFGRVGHFHLPATLALTLVPFRLATSHTSEISAPSPSLFVFLFAVSYLKSFACVLIGMGHGVKVIRANVGYRFTVFIAHLNGMDYRERTVCFTVGFCLRAHTLCMCVWELITSWAGLARGRREKSAERISGAALKLGWRFGLGLPNLGPTW